MHKKQNLGQKVGNKVFKVLGCLPYLGLIWYSLLTEVAAWQNG